MTLIEIVREVSLPPEETWRRLTDWSAHASHVPLTTIRPTETGFIARTGLGPLGFDDPMEIVVWQPPTSCRLEKRGRVMTGWAEIDVAVTPAGSRAVWREEIHPRGLPRVADPLVRWSARRLFGRVIDQLLTG